MKTLRVLHIYRTYFPETRGGGQEAIRQLCLATQPLGVDNTIFALARQPEPHVMERPEGKLVRARSWLEVASCDIGAWAAFRRCRDAAAQCDIIQIHFPWPFEWCVRQRVHLIGYTRADRKRRCRSQQYCLLRGKQK